MKQLRSRVPMAALGLAVLGVVGGCSSGTSGYSTLHKTTPGESAMTVARTVRACTQVQQSATQSGIQLSAATCVLDGQLIRFITYASAGAESNDPALDGLPGKVGHYAMGDGYVAIAASPSATVADQETLAQTIVKALGGSVVDYQNSP